MTVPLPAPQTTAPSPREAATACARSCWLHAGAGILCRGERRCRGGFAGCRLPSFTGTCCVIAAAFRRVKLGRILLLKAFWRAGCSPVPNLGEIFSRLCSAWNKQCVQMQMSRRGEACRHAQLRALQWAEMAP